MTMARQMALDLPEWGGKRRGAGRPRTRPHPGLDGPGVPHLGRPQFAARHPIRYVTTNYRHHARENLPRAWSDPLATSPDAPFTAPSVWLLRVGWRVPRIRRSTI